MTDESIIGLFQERSDRAIAETERKYGELCRYIARNLLGSPQDAEECVNDSLMKLWESIPQAAPRSLQAYVVRTVRNTALDLLRRRTAQKRGSGQYELLIEELRDIAGPDPIESLIERGVLSEAINGFLASISPEKRMVFMRRYWYAEPVKSVAKALGMTVGQVKMSLSRTRKEFRSYLEKEGIEL